MCVSTTVRMYLAAIRFYCLFNLIHNPLHDFNGHLKFSIHALLKAVEKVQKPSRRCRSLINSILLSHIYTSLHGSYFDVYWDAFFTTVLSCAFFDLLRPGKFTTWCFNPAHNLSLSDVSFVSGTAILHLKRSKSDRFDRDVTIRYYQVKILLRPIVNRRQCLKLPSILFSQTRAPQTSLFLMPNGKALSRTELVTRLHNLLSPVGYNPSRYFGHSLRIRATL